MIDRRVDGDAIFPLVFAGVIFNTGQFLLSPFSVLGNWRDLPPSPTTTPFLASDVGLSPTYHLFHSPLDN